MSNEELRKLQDSYDGDVKLTHLYSPADHIHSCLLLYVRDDVQRVLLYQKGEIVSAWLLCSEQNAPAKDK